MYVSPQHLRSMQIGIDLDDFDDAHLAFILRRARALTDAYCSVPTLPVPHDFRGGSISNESHRWRVGTDVTPGAHRVYPWHRPLRTVTALSIYVTGTQYLDIDTDALFINESAGYVEIASLNLTPYGIFGAAVLPMVGLQEPISKTSYTYGRRIPVVGEQMYATDGLLYRAQNQWWESTIPAEIKVDGSVVTTGITLDYDEGTVEFDAANPAGAKVTASYTYRLPGEIAQAQAMIASALLSEHELVAKGMGRLASIQVEEVSLRRTIGQRTEVIEPSIPTEAMSLLDGFVFMSIR